MMKKLRWLRDKSLMYLDPTKFLMKSWSSMKLTTNSRDLTMDTIRVDIDVFKFVQTIFIYIYIYSSVYYFYIYSFLFPPIDWKMQSRFLIMGKSFLQTCLKMWKCICLLSVLETFWHLQITMTKSRKSLMVEEMVMVLRSATFLVPSWCWRQLLVMRRNYSRLRRVFTVCGASRLSTLARMESTSKWQKSFFPSADTSRWKSSFSTRTFVLKYR